MTDIQIISPNNQSKRPHYLQECTASVYNLKTKMKQCSMHVIPQMRMPCMRHDVALT